MSGNPAIRRVRSVVTDLCPSDSGDLVRCVGQGFALPPWRVLTTRPLQDRSRVRNLMTVVLVKRPECRTFQLGRVVSCSGLHAGELFGRRHIDAVGGPLPWLIRS